MAHPGAQLRFEEVEVMRVTAFATNPCAASCPT
jgi:hypothetical protein